MTHQRVDRDAELGEVLPLAAMVCRRWSAIASWRALIVSGALAGASCQSGPPRRVEAVYHHYDCVQELVPSNREVVFSADSARLTDGGRRTLEAVYREAQYERTDVSAIVLRVVPDPAAPAELSRARVQMLRETLIAMGAPPETVLDLPPDAPRSTETTRGAVELWLRIERCIEAAPACSPATPRRVSCGNGGERRR